MKPQVEFVKHIDRFLEVSNVYARRIRQTISREDQPERMDRLINILEAAAPRAAHGKIKSIASSENEGQSVVPTHEVLQETDEYKELVLERLESSTQILPRNNPTLKRVLKLPAAEFLGSFETITYAWDILTELASLSVLPRADELFARDMIHMHTVELKLHLTRLLSAAAICTPSTIIELRGKQSIDTLMALEAENGLTARLLEFSAPDDPELLLERIRSLVNKPPMLTKKLSTFWDKIETTLCRESQLSPDPFNPYYYSEEYEAVCDEMVIFGLTAGYATWFGTANSDLASLGSLRKNALFCTRILLDEQRWRVCSEIADVAKELSYAVNEINGKERTDGTHMLTANMLYAKKMCGKDIIEETQTWDVSKIHERYKFLQLILLDKFEEAAKVAKILIEKVESSGRPNMCLREFEEWPILEAFRTSDIGANFIRSHSTNN
jgi:hypothetical protein